MRCHFYEQFILNGLNPEAVHMIPMLEFCEISLTLVDVARFHNDGFLTIDLVTNGSIDSLQLEAERVWDAAHTEEYDSGASWLSNALLVGVHEHSALFREVFYRAPLVDVMTQLIGPNIKLASNQLTFKHSGDSNPYDWHQDNGYGPLFPETAISCWLALDEVNDLNGCLWIIPGSNKHGSIGHSAGKPRERIATIEDEGSAIPIPLRAGQCVIFHGFTLHMSKGNSTGRMRRAVFFRYADADAIDLEGRPRVGKLLRGISKFTEVNECSELVCNQKSASRSPIK